MAEKPKMAARHESARTQSILMQAIEISTTDKNRAHSCKTKNITNNKNSTKNALKKNCLYFTYFGRVSTFTHSLRVNIFVLNFKILRILKVAQKHFF
jgi:hypothetical protein